MVARNVPPTDIGVLSVTRIAAGDAYNVIPQTATLWGTARAFSRETMSLIEASMRRLASGVAAGFGATAALVFRFRFAPVVNVPAEADAMANAAAAVAGETAVERHDALNNVSEDFSDLMEQIPGAMIHIGNGASADLHQPTYDFNDEAIPYGVALWATLVEQKLAKGVA